MINQSPSYRDNTPSTRTGDGEIQEYQNTPEIYRNPCFNPQLFQSGTSSLQPQKLHEQMICRFGRVAPNCRLCRNNIEFNLPLKITLTKPFFK
jgi:hypothetical protein